MGLKWQIWQFLFFLVNSVFVFHLIFILLVCDCIDVVHTGCFIISFTLSLIHILVKYELIQQCLHTNRKSKMWNFFLKYNEIIAFRLTYHDFISDGIIFQYGFDQNKNTDIAKLHHKSQYASKVVQTINAFLPILKRIEIEQFIW